MKNEILQTSLKQFLKYGIREMSIQKLVAPLGISTKTVYKYFENKEQLLEEALNLYYVQQYGLVQTFDSSKNVVGPLFHLWYMGIEAECNVNKVFFQDLNYYYPELERKVEATVSKKIWKQFISVIEKGIQQGFFRDDIDPEIILEAISSVYVSIARTRNFKRFKTSLSTIFLNTIAVIIRGFCTTKGVEELDSYIALVTTSGKIKAFELVDTAKN
ncbi:MAG: TetR/AcrR family transcriptional regulator [Cyclobacteriaceae bacterium]